LLQLESTNCSELCPWSQARRQPARCRSHHPLSFLLEPIDGFSDTSKLRIWFGLRALEAIEAIGQMLALRRVRQSFGASSPIQIDLPAC
jgi:hypothetical protein